MEIYILWGLVIASIIFSCYAQTRVSLSYNKYSKILASSSVTARVLARQILDIAGLKDVKIVQVRGVMTDYYHPKKNIIALSEGVGDSSSISALGIMAHEVGHALQVRDNYFPIKLKNVAVVITNIFSKLMWPMLIIGVLLDILIVTEYPIGMTIIYISLGFFVLSTILSLLALPIEYNASKRALQLLSETNALRGEELEGAKEVLKCAGLTYLAGFVGSAVNLLRILFIFTQSRK